jgi:hypothetical protein
MKRPRAALAAAAAAALLAYLYWPIAAPAAAPPGPGDCVEFELWSNGFHTDLALPAALLPAQHPVRQLFPEAQSFLIGWGDEAFYRSDGRDLLAGLAALVPPSASTVHVIAESRDVRAYFVPQTRAVIAVSRAEAERLADFIAAEIALNEAGAPIVIVPGKLQGRSLFLRGRTGFHAFNVCNHWMARALRAAGLDVNARAAWFGGPLVEDARRHATGACPAGNAT